MHISIVYLIVVENNKDKKYSDTIQRDNLKMDRI